MSRNKRNLTPTLLLGDALTIILVTLLGLGFHESREVFGIRLIVNSASYFGPWWLAARAVGLLDQTKAGLWSSLQAIPLAVLFSAPLGAALRGFILSRPILPVFVLIIGVALIGGLAVWRVVFIHFIARRSKSK